MKNLIKTITLTMALLAAGSSANAYTWSQPNIFGGYNYHGDVNGWSQPNIFGGYNYYGDVNGWSQPNIFGGYDFHLN